MIFLIPSLHHLGQLIYARKIVLMITIVPIPKYASKRNAKWVVSITITVRTVKNAINIHAIKLAKLTKTAHLVNIVLLMKKSVVQNVCQTMSVDMDLYVKEAIASDLVKNQFVQMKAHTVTRENLFPFNLFLNLRRNCESLTLF